MAYVNYDDKIFGDGPVLHAKKCYGILVIFRIMFGVFIVKVFDLWKTCWYGINDEIITIIIHTFR